MPDTAGGRPQSAAIWPPEAILGEDILEATVDLVISLVTVTVAGADGVSVSLRSRDGGGFHTGSATSGDVRDVDAVQYATNAGPCVDAARIGESVNTAISSQRRRWPEFAKEAAKRGWRSILSVPLVNGDGVIGALNVYSQSCQPFAEAGERVVAHFARHAAVVLTNASEFLTTGWINEQLVEAISKADVLGQAKGILIAKGYSHDEALASLRRASDRSNRTMSEVAQDMVVSNWRGRPS